ncbi:MAG: hypothetical protein ACLS21_06825 [Lachnospiraceae bacterium]
MVQKTKKILVISGGAIEASFMLKYIEEQQFRYIIAADSGMEFYISTEKPDMIVGDFDSVDPAVLEAYRKWTALVESITSGKRRYGYRVSSADCTELGAEEIHIVGGTEAG